MKKTLLTFFAFVCAVVAGAQTTVTFDSNTQGWTSDAGAQTSTVDGVTISTTQGVLGVTSGTYTYRIYKSQTFTVSSKVGDITSIEFTCSASGTAKYGPGCFSTPSVGSYSYNGNVGTWTGSASEVQFTAQSNQVRATQIVVTVGGATTAISTPSITVDGSNVTITGPENYGLIYTIDGTDPDERNGVVTASNTATFTVDQSCTVKAITVDNNDMQNCSSVASKSVTITKVFNTAEQPVSVGEALSLLAQGALTDAYIYTKGTVHYVKEVSTSYGNATYSITDGQDTLLVYRGLGLDNAKFTAEDDLMVGDEVTVYGQLVNYNQTTPEYTSGNYIVAQTKVDRPSVDPDPDPTPTEYTLTGDGTLSNPYTAADVVYLYDNKQYGTDPVWVKGTILGSVSSVSNNLCNLNDSGSDVASNIALGTENANIPVALPAKSEARTAINVLDNPTNVGKEVWVYGIIQAYFQFAGVKSVTDFSFDGQSTAISAVSAETSQPCVTYNLAGQKVSGTYKGVVVKSGKKYSIK